MSFDSASDLKLQMKSVIRSYRTLLQIFIDLGFSAITHAEWFAGPRSGKSLLMRHDVDHDIERAVVMARVERDLGVHSTYYLLPPGAYERLDNYYGVIENGVIVPSERMKELALEIQSLGHEVGIHNDFIQLGYRLGRNPEDLLREQIELLRGIGIRVAGTASHGSKFARAHGFTNYDLFREKPETRRRPDFSGLKFKDGSAIPLNSVSYRQHGLLYEAYEVSADTRITDSGSTVTALFRNRGASDKPVSEALAGEVDLEWLQLMLEESTVAVVLIHPDWWEPFAAGVTPSAVGFNRPPPPVTSLAPVRRDGPVRILIRGDCSSRRAVAMNRDLFPSGTKWVVNGKSPNVFFKDALVGKTATVAELRGISNVDQMPKGLQHYYLGQADRSVLDSEGDLLVMDSYADMNFVIWENRASGHKIWIHPQFLRNRKEFEEEYRCLGRRTLDEAVADAKATIGGVRARNPGIPVLFLNQQVEFYSKLSDRREFYEMGARLAREVEGVFYGGTLETGDLGLADVGSCGPGQTLHFTGDTYRRMIDGAAHSGLWAALTRSGQSEAPASGQQRALSAPIGRSALNVEAVPEPRSLSPVPTVSSLDGTDDTLPARSPEPASAQNGSQAAAAPQSGAMTDRVVQSPEMQRIAAATGVPSVVKGDTRRPREGAAAVSLQIGSETCIRACENVWTQARKSFANYFYFVEDDCPPPKWVPCVIPVDEVLDFEAWERRIRKFEQGNRNRAKNKAKRLGFYTKIFNPKLFVPDLFAVNTSTAHRSGGAMRGGYLRTIEEMGGPPVRYYPPDTPKCLVHWGLSFGVFVREPGHCQGDIQVDERLVGYVSLRRIGDFACYSTILGHAEYLKNGIMILLHHDIVEWIGQNRDHYTKGLRYLMYGAVSSGGPGLMHWKKCGGFRGLAIDAFRNDLPEGDIDGTLFELEQPPSLREAV